MIIAAINKYPPIPKEGVSAPKSPATLIL